MGIYSTNTILNPPASTNESTINSGNGYPKNNAITYAKHGMPGKSGVADNQTSFGLARLYYFQYNNPESLIDLEKLYKKKANDPNKNIRASKISNSTIKTSTIEVGKPIPQNGNDLYLQRKRLIAIGSGSTNKEGEKLSFNGLDRNIPVEARRRAKAGGSIAPNLGRIGPSQPSIFCRRSRR